MRKVVLLLALLLPLTSQAEVRSKYLKALPTKERKEKKVKVPPPAITWTAYGKLVGRVDNLLIIKTKEGKFLLKEDYR